MRIDFDSKLPYCDVVAERPGVAADDGGVPEPNDDREMSLHEPLDLATASLTDERRLAD